MQRKNFFGGGQFAPSLGRTIPLRRFFMGVPQDLPPTCAANERLVIKVENLQEKWVCEPVPAGAPAPPPPAPPAGNPPAAAPAAAPAPACSVPEGYGPLPGGGAAVDHAVMACPMPDGTYDVLNIRSFAPVMQGVSRACLDLFGDVTIKTVEDAVCSGPPPANTTPGDCPIPSGDKYVMCPPSNGVTVDYFLNAKTAAYGAGFTTMPASCKDSPNVIQVGPNSPYCAGSNVEGAGNDYPQLVACFKQAGQFSSDEGLVDIHNGPDMALLEAGVMIKDIPARFPGKRYIIVTDMFCSALPDFGQAPVAPPPAPVPAPGPVPAPPVATPLPPLPAPPPPTPVHVQTPEPDLGPILVIMPPPMAQPSPCDAGTWLRQRPAPSAGPAPALGSPRRVPLRRGPF